MTNSPAQLAMTNVVVTQQSIKVTLTAPVNGSPHLLQAFVFHSIGGDAKELEPLPVNAVSPTSGTTSELTFTFKGPLAEQDVVRVSFPSPKADSIEELASFHLPSPQQHLFRMVSGEAFAAPSASAAATGGGGGNGSIKKDLGITAESFEDAITYPFLTEEVGLPPAPITGAGGAGYGGGGSSSKSSLGQSASQAIADVLGWRANANDPSGFVGALSQSFTLTEVEGHVEARWVPRSYAVQTDLAGGITGAQASLLFRMKEAVDQSLPLIEGLTPLRRDPDWEYITAAKGVIKSQLQELVNELSMPGSLRVARVDQIFRILFEPPLARPAKLLPETVEFETGKPTAASGSTKTSPTKDAAGDLSFETGSSAGHVSVHGRYIEVDPDWVGGQIGALRLQLGLRSRPHRNHFGVVIEDGDLVNTVDDETDQTNYRMVVDYLSSMWISWLNNRRFFELPIAANVQPFFGTQLVLLSRALSVVAEKVNELRFALDSVFIGQAERQALQLHFQERIVLLDGEKEDVPSQAMFLEDLLTWVYSFATDEGPRLIQTGGRYGVRDSFLPVAKSLRILVHAARNANGGTVHGFKTARVRRAMDELGKQLKFLADMARPIESPIELAAHRLSAGQV